MERLDKDMAFRNGLMEQYMKDIGTIIKQKEKEPFGMLKEIFI